MLIWKFYRTACERHVAKEFSPVNWYLSPEDFTRPDNWLPAGEAVSLEFCGICKDSYTKWKHHPRPQCDCDCEEVGACPIMCTSPTVLPALRLEHVQSKSSSQRLSEGKKLPTLKTQSGQKGKTEANKNMGISKKVMAGVNQGRTSSNIR